MCAWRWLLSGLLWAGCAATEGPLLRANSTDGDGGADGGTDSPAASAVQPGMRLQYQLVGALDTTDEADLFVVDLFGTEDVEVAALHARGRVVAAYVAAGSREPWRPDADDFAAEAIGAPLSGYPDESWLDVRDPSVRQVMQARLELAVDKSFDGVLLSSLDAYARDSGHDLSADDQLDYNLWLAGQARGLGLSPGVSSDWAQAPSLAAAYDFAVTVNCLAADRCADLDPYIEAGRAVFDLETAGSPELLCPQAAALNLPVTLKRDGFDAWFHACP